MKQYWVKEMFGPTINGEGSRAGEVVKFLRFAGCNKWSGVPETKAKSICWYCDTDFFGGLPMNPTEIVKALNDLGPVKRLVISGGEATLQLDHELLSALVDAGYKLYLETNGSRPLKDLTGYFTHVTMSPKQGRDKTRLELCNDLKILYPFISDDITLEKFNDFPHDQGYLQPLDTDDSTHLNSLRAAQFLYENPTWKLSVQIHKILGVK